MGAGYRKSLNIGEHYSYSENLTQFFFFSGEQKKIFHRGRIIQLSTFLLFFSQRDFAPRLQVFVVGEGMGLIVFIFILIKEGKSILQTFCLDSTM